MELEKFKPGVAVELLPGIRRLVAPNGGVMTGPGTNTYLLGEKDVTVVDPGPAIDEHVDAILRVAAERGGKVTQIVCTHTHPDHSPAAAPLKARSGAKVIGRRIDDDGFQDTTFAPDYEPDHDRDIPIEGGALRAIHTPGHVDNHFCFLHEGSGMLFTGDHIMQGSTVVIIPPAGDMQHYIASLECLLEYPLRVLAPGHGDIIDNPLREVEWLVGHRLDRETKVVDKLAQFDDANLEELVVPVYDDVDKSLHPVAQFSLWAHLLKLQKEGRADEVDGRWHLLR